MRVFLSFMGQQASVKLVHRTAAKSLKSHAVMLMDFVCVQKCRSDVSNDYSVGEMVASPHPSTRMKDVCVRRLTANTV